MDQEVVVKKELVWLEGAANILLDSCINNAAENDSIVKVESQTSITLKVEDDTVDSRTEDDILVQNFDVPPGIRCLQEETKSELTVPGPLQQNTFQPSGDIKEEILIDEHSVDQLASCLKEGNNLENGEVLTRSPVYSDHGFCNKLENGIPLKCNLRTDGRKQIFRCTLCNRVFNTKGILTRHSLSHSGQDRLDCYECGKAFSQKRYLKMHLSRHFGGRTHQCNQCLKSFARKCDLERHNLCHTAERPFRCNECGSAFARKSTLHAHSLSHSGLRSYICKQCGSAFLTNGSLKRHVFSHSGERCHICNKCGKAFSRKGTLQLHMLIHTRPEIPNYSDSAETFVRDFECKTELTSHPFYCNKCVIVFETADKLRNHMLSHYKERPHICRECGKAFIKKSTLKIHSLIHSRGITYNCNECSKSFIRKGDIIKHLLSHSEHRPFCCNVCDSAFKRKSHLNSHLLTHSAEGPIPL